VQPRFAPTCRTPEALRARLIAEYAITEQDAVCSPAIWKVAKYTKRGERCEKSQTSREPASDRVFADCKASPFVRLPLPPEGLRFAADQIESGAITSTASKSILTCSPRQGLPIVYEANKPQQVSDPRSKDSRRSDRCQSQEVEQYRGGKTTVTPSSSVR